MLHVRHDRPLQRCAAATAATPNACSARPLACAVFEDLVVRTVGTSHAGPHADASAESAEAVRAKTKEACPKCAHPELMFYTLQLRSASWR